MFKRILVPIDGSRFSINAARKAVTMAQIMGSKITLLHVVNHSQLFSLGPPQSMPIVTDQMIEGLNSGGERILKDALKALNPMTVEVESQLAWGVPSQVIVEIAREDKYDLIIMGSRGLNAITGLLLGSVSDRVSKLAPCPVMIVKEK
jgi:nucleotide-binding universal stress UspA family protein